MHPLAALLAGTLRALLAPRRLVPIALVAVPMVLAQVRFSSDGRAAWGAALMIVLFLGLGPFAWRALFPQEGPPPTLPLPARLGIYGLAGALPPAVGWVLPEWFDIGETFLTAGINLFISATLFWVGGWGLGRDIDLEQGLQRARARAEAAVREAERAHLLALRAHLDPHFLFNTLNAIAEWCREDGAVAEAAILRLSGLLRQVMAGVREPLWPLSRELGLVRDLFELHRVRDPDRFQATCTLDDALADTPIPPLLLLPLAENAMKHGPARGHPGTVYLVATRDGDHLLVRITNPGPFAPTKPGEGVAMVRKRLELAWPGRGTLTLGPAADGGTEAVVRFPLTAPRPEDVA